MKLAAIIILAFAPIASGGSSKASPIEVLRKLGAITWIEENDSRLILATDSSSLALNENGKFLPLSVVVEKDRATFTITDGTGREGWIETSGTGLRIQYQSFTGTMTGSVASDLSGPGIRPVIDQSICSCPHVEGARYERVCRPQDCQPTGNGRCATADSGAINCDMANYEDPGCGGVSPILPVTYALFWFSQRRPRRRKS